MFTLETEKRESLGKMVAKARVEGKLPIVVYGAKETATPYFVDLKKFKKLLSEAGESSIIGLAGAAGEKDILIHDVAYHPLSGEPIHADLLVVEKNKPLEVHVPLEFIGVAPAEKELGAAIIKVMHEVEIRALPKDLPPQLTVDLSVLKTLSDRIKVADLALPAGVTAISDPEEIVVSVTEAGEEVKEEEAPVDLSAIEVEKKGKKEEEGAETEEAAE